VRRTSVIVCIGPAVSECPQHGLHLREDWECRAHGPKIGPVLGRNIGRTMRLERRLGRV
jgi:hypothetical protein